MSAPDWLLGSSLLFGGSLAGAFLALAFATSRRRIAMLLALGAVLGVGFVLFAYLSAPTDARESNCSDCGYYGGRYWEPQLVIAILVWNLATWSAAVLVGGALRRRIEQRRTSRRAEPAWH